MFTDPSTIGTGVLSDLLSFLHGTCRDTDTSCAHVTMEEVEKGNDVSAVVSAPLTQAAAALQTIMQSIAEPEITHSEMFITMDGQSAEVCRQFQLIRFSLYISLVTRRII